MPRDTCFVAMAFEEVVCPKSATKRAKRLWRRVKIKMRSVAWTRLGGQTLKLGGDKYVEHDPAGSNKAPHSTSTTL